MHQTATERLERVAIRAAANRRGNIGRAKSARRRKPFKKRPTIVLRRARLPTAVTPRTMEVLEGLHEF